MLVFDFLADTPAEALRSAWHLSSVCIVSSPPGVKGLPCWPKSGFVRTVQHVTLRPSPLVQSKHLFSPTEEYRAPDKRRTPIFSLPPTTQNPSIGTWHSPTT